MHKKMICLCDNGDYNAINNALSVWYPTFVDCHDHNVDINCTGLKEKMIQLSDLP